MQERESETDDSQKSKNKWQCSAVGRFLLTAIETHSTAFHHHYPSYILVSYPCIIQNVVLLLLLTTAIKRRRRTTTATKWDCKMRDLAFFVFLNDAQQFQLTFRKRGRAGGICSVERIQGFEVDPLIPKMFT